MPLLSVENLKIGYRRGHPILPAVNFSLEGGQVCSIVGHNGSGKSTLLKTILGLIDPVSGKIKKASGARFGYVPQRESIDPIYPVRVEELVETGRYAVRGAGKWLERADREKVQKAMRATGIAHASRQLFRTLSGGQQQRALLARALCVEPRILVLDEPTASLDEKGAAEIMRLTVDLAKKEGAAILMVNHFIDLVAEISDFCVVLDGDHQRVKVGTPKEVLPRG